MTKIFIKHAFLKIKEIEKAHIIFERQNLSDEASGKIMELKAEIKYLDLKYQEAAQVNEDLTNTSLDRVEIINVFEMIEYAKV